MQTQQRLAIGGAAMMMVGSICPWASAFGLISLSGLQCRLGWGTLLAGGFLVSLELRPTWMGRRLGWLLRHHRPVKLGTAVLSILICVLAIVGLGEEGALVQVEWGTYLTLIAAGAVICSTLRRAV